MDPKIEKILVLAKFSDGKVRQIVTKIPEDNAILSILVRTSENGAIKVIQKPIEGFDFSVSGGLNVNVSN